ncbi:hypothetical protein EC973_009620 [Apophysomyces ossiformis]|uniref:F-box domain-containing protein n=1 Tax=Apophysomyces ossiformis TaxID=679940 RepID=A0A8H7EQ83_9FUNG|nr:hypothetical protein EC973_009620 [Apophysomyces ossiformis]
MISDASLQAKINTLSLNCPINRVPSEILLSIAQRLSWKKLHILVRVCRLWHTVLIPEVYHSIKIVSKAQFRLLKDAVSRRPYGQLVRQLELQSLLDEEEIILLPELFPFVTELRSSVERLLWLLPNWKRLEKVESLSMSTPKTLPTECLGRQLQKLSLVVTNIEAWMSILSELPSLVDLALKFDIGNGENLSFSDLETIINGLPRLRSLELLFLHAYGGLPEPVLPCNTLRHLHLRGGGRGYGAYFARKCSRLETLNAYWTKLDLDSEVLIQSCRQLKQLILHDQDIYQSCTDILQKIDAPIEKLSFYAGDDWTWYRKTLYSFQSTITTVAIKALRGMPVDEMLVDELKGCHSLKVLSVSCFTGSLKIDWVLDHLIHLQTLELAGEYIGISDDYHMKIRRTLRTITMTADDIEDEVFVYLASTCPKISSIECSFTGQTLRHRAICYMSPGLRVLQINSRYNTLFKITQLNAEECIHCRDWEQAQVYQVKSGMVGCTRWFHRGWYDNMPPIYPDESIQIRGLVQRLINTNDEQSVKAFFYEFYLTYYRQPEFWVDNPKKDCEQKRIVPLPIIWAICPYVDDIRFGVV